MRRVARVAGLLAAMALSSAGYAQGLWEGQPLTTAQKQACRSLPRALVRPVLAAFRDAAAQQLGSSLWAPVPDGQASAWLGVPAPKDQPLAERLLADALAVLEDRRLNSINEHANKWVASEQAAYDLLLEVRGHPHGPLLAYLARGIEGAGPGGVFDAADCGGALALRHGVRGAVEGAATPAPVLVFLEAPPTAVQAWRETIGP